MKSELIKKLKEALELAVEYTKKNNPTERLIVGLIQKPLALLDPQASRSIDTRTTPEVENKQAPKTQFGTTPPQKGSQRAQKKSVTTVVGNNNKPQQQKETQKEQPKKEAETPQNKKVEDLTADDLLKIGMEMSKKFDAEQLKIFAKKFGANLKGSTNKAQYAAAIISAIENGSNDGEKEDLEDTDKVLKEIEELNK